MQCCGSGSECGIHRIHMFLGLLDPYPDPLVRSMYRIRFPIRILLSPSKNSKKNLDSYCFVTSFWHFIFENDVNVPSKVISKKLVKKIVFVGVLKVNDENSRIRFRIHKSEAWIRGSRSGSTPKCHGSATLIKRKNTCLAFGPGTQPGPLSQNSIHSCLTLLFFGNLLSFFGNLCIPTRVGHPSMQHDGMSENDTLKSRIPVYK
jgi:hypothetical protein